MSKQTPLVLASASPRRAELLKTLDFNFEVRVSQIDESQQDGESALAYVQRLAREKAHASCGVRTGSQDSGEIFLGADTSVVLGDRIFGKPANRDEAIDMLLSLSERTHTVITALALVGNSVSNRSHSETRVTFGRIDRAQASAYWDSGEPCDKAGGYAIQGLASAFVQRIEGSYSGVVGLPAFECTALLAEAGIRPRWCGQTGAEHG